jgi:hypothetical protein
LHETIHESHTKNLDGAIFEIDFEKTYDTWSEGLALLWSAWIENFMEK